MIRAALAGLFLFLPLFAAQANDDIVVKSVPLDLNRQDFGQTVVGKLQWRGGVALSARHPAFGGYSGMAIEQNGARLRAISDTGTWLTATLRYDAAGRLAGMDRATVGPLLGTDGHPLSDKSMQDAESMTLLGNGSVLVGFERHHRIWNYPAGSEATGSGLAGRPVPFSAPAQLQQAPKNEGLEALARLKDGRLLAISEDLRLAPDRVAAWIGVPQDGSYRWQGLSYRTLGAFHPTDAAVLPSGDVVVSERSYNPTDGVRVRIMRLRLPALVAGAELQPEELARLEPPVVTENLEGLGAGRGPKGETLLWIMSDDNFNPLQRTILLHFALVD